MEDRFVFTINEHYKGDNMDLMEDEYYCLMIENFGEDVYMKIDVKDDGDDSDEDSDKDSDKDSTINDKAIFIKFVGWIIAPLLFIL